MHGQTNKIKKNLGHFILKITYSLPNSNTGFDTKHDMSDA